MPNGKTRRDGTQLMFDEPELTVHPASMVQVLKPKRDRKAEDARAAEAQLDKALQLRRARDAYELDEVMQIAQALILCGLPYVPTKERQIVRVARLADGSEVRVTFTAALSKSQMPYGSDRTLLYFLLDKAVKADSRFVSWKTATEFLTAMGMQTASGKNYHDLRSRFSRIRGLAIGIERTRAGVDGTLLTPIIRRSALPSSLDVDAERRGQEVLPLSPDVPYGVEFDQDFFHDVKQHHVPYPVELLRATRKQSQLQDLCLFIQWRCYAAKAASVIPWESLRQQVWHADTNPRRIKQRVSEAIDFLRKFWPELQAEARKEGLWVAPPKDQAYLLPKGQAARRQRIAQRAK